MMPKLRRYAQGCALFGVASLLACSPNTAGHEGSVPHGNLNLAHAQTFISHLPDASRETSYESLNSLVLDSPTIVVADASEAPLRLDEAYGLQEAPLAIEEMRVIEVLKGGYPDGTVQIATEAYYDAKGALASDKFQTGSRYLLFLTNIGAKEPSVYAVTGYLAGLYIYISDGADDYVKLDPENPGLPSKTSLEEVERLIGK